MIAPSVATRMDQRLKPVAPAPPRSLTRNPPMEAPAIPMRTVTMKPPGPVPGKNHLASNPAISPTTTQEMIPISLLLVRRRFTVLIGSMTFEHVNSL
jgi:hypothetical protein